MLPLAGSCAALSRAVTSRDVLSQGSSRMKQQNAAWPADSRSHIPSVWSPLQRGLASEPTSPPSKGTASSSIHLLAAAFVCSGEFGNAAGLQLLAGQEGSAELSPQLRANPALIPSAVEQVISQRCYGTNKQMVACSEQQGLQVKPVSSSPEVRRNDGSVGAKPWGDAVLG